MVNIKIGVLFKILFEILVIVILAISCKSSFTGEITYKTTIISNDGNRELFDNYVFRYGDTLQIDYQYNGDMIRHHKNGLINYQLFSVKDGAVYFIYHNLKMEKFPCDTLTLTKVYKKRIKDEMIAGEKCRCYEILSIHNSKRYPVLLQSCYPKNIWKYYLNPDLYKTYQDYFMYEMFKQNKTPYFKFLIQYKEISILYEGVKVNFEKRN